MVRLSPQSGQEADRSLVLSSHQGRTVPLTRGMSVERTEADTLARHLGRPDRAW